MRREFSKYFIVGVSGVFLDLGTLIFIKEYAEVKPAIAVALNQVIVLTYNFSLNKYWSFRNRAMPHKQIVRYLIIAGINYCISVSVMFIFNHHFLIDYRLVRLGTIVLMVPTNFLVYKYWVYKEEYG